MQKLKKKKKKNMWPMASLVTQVIIKKYEEKYEVKYCPQVNFKQIQKPKSYAANFSNFWERNFPLY